MAWPSGTPVAQQVFEHIVTTLQAIQGAPNFKTTVKSVRVAGKDVTELDHFPAILVQPWRASYRDDTAPTIRGEMLLTIQPIVASDVESEIPDKLTDLIEDIRVALLTDHTRGGIAHTTQVQSSEPYAIVEGWPVFAADLFVVVLYRHLYLDPATAI